MKNFKNEIKEALDIYSFSTNINSKVFDKNNSLICCSSSYNENKFCSFIKDKCGKEKCLQSYKYGGLQAQKFGEPYIYFCPYGLVNWSVPITQNGKMKYFIVGGAVLLHKVDDFLIEKIIKESCLDSNDMGKIRNYLNKIAVIDTVRTRYLSKLLEKLSIDLMNNFGNETNFIESKKRYNKGAALVAETIHFLKDNNYDYDESHYPLEKENELIAEVKLGHREKSMEILNKILGIIYFKSGDDFKIVKARSIELMVALARSVIEIGADLESVFGLEYEYFENINKAEDINQLSSILSKFLDGFINCIFSIASLKNKDTIFKAINYIKDNFYNNDLKLNDVAEHIGLSSSYFSTIFKEETGLSYTEYLHKVRIETAKEYLKNDYSLAAVAQAVGFNDQSYFSRVFKKMEGISPGRWKPS
jgi:AraC-like DNA-binding protein/ligand-binding sensor protein